MRTMNKIKVNVIQDSILVLYPLDETKMPSIIIGSEEINMGDVHLNSMPKGLVILEFSSLEAINYLMLTCEEALKTHPFGTTKKQEYVDSMRKLCKDTLAELEKSMRR